MEEHCHCSCSHANNQDKQKGIVLRWLVSLIFIALSFIVMRPFIARQLLSRASSYMACELFNDAIRSYKKAVFMDNRNITAWNMIGYSYKISGDLKNAVNAYQKVLKTDPQDRSANFSLGVILASEKKYKEAVPYFEQIRAFGPEKKGLEIDIASYHKSSLRLLADCYGALEEIKKRDAVLEELRRYYPAQEAARR
ncbi:MAG: tetratricopeptide repeat protein [Candidatus Omnitrophota bacterium]|jgi:tetratricopeptide (TPR) repeat protein